VINIELNERQEKIIEIVKKNQPITSEEIARNLQLARATIRPDLSILTMSGILDARPRVGYFLTGKTSINNISKKINSICVGDIQSTPVVLEEFVSIYNAIVTIFLENVDSIFITNKGILVGIISRKDIIRSMMGGTDLQQVPIGVIMTRMPNIIYIRPEENVLTAAKKLIDHEINSLPVIENIEEDSQKMKVIGRITKTTITNLFVELGKDM